MIDAITGRGRDPYPRKIRFTTWTLAYNCKKWVVIGGLGKHSMAPLFRAVRVDPIAALRME